MEKNIFALLLMLLSSSFVAAQDTLSITLDSTAEARPLVIDAAYENWSLHSIPFAVEQISATAFNQGLISDPVLLLQGRVAGMQAYNRGGDPNIDALVRIRGLSALSQRQPLFVIDGVPGVALESLDPNDIASITVLKDGASQALYGIRASNGVVLINTKLSNARSGRLTIAYSGQVATSEGHAGIPVLNAANFVDEGGWDLGSNTAWMDEIQRLAFSHTQGLAVGGRTANTDYRIAGNYRDVDGVLQKSGFEQANLRANFGTSLLNDKLRVRITSSYTNRNSQFGFQDAFRYAVSFNPTAPVFAEDAPFPFSSTQFGGYYEARNLFDSFNPVALINLNDRYGKDQVFNGQALLQYNLLPKLRINMRYAYQNHFINQRAYYAPQSLFRGNAGSPRDSLRGRADLRDIDDYLSVYEFFINYGTVLGQSRLDLTLGTSYSDGATEDLQFRIYGFDNPALVETRRIDDYANWQEEANGGIDTMSSGWATRHSGFFGRLQFNIADELFFHAALRTEGSSRLGENNRWATFPAIGGAWDLAKNMQGVDRFKLRASYGLTGAVPDAPGLYSSFVRTIINPNGADTETEVRAANPNLQWEKKREMNIGLDIHAGRFQGYIEWYSRWVSNWIEPVPGQFSEQYGNTNALRSTGIELGLDAILLQGRNVSYHSGLRLTTFRSTFSELSLPVRVIASNCCNSNSPIIAAKEGERVGELLAPVFTDFDPETGAIIFEDMNGDGFIAQDASTAYSEDGDLAVAGNGLPNLELGWTHRFRYGKWELRAFLRGAFGHHLFNTNRRFYESQLFSRSSYNYVNTELRVDGLRSTSYADIYIEKANFIKLDFLTLAKTFIIGDQANAQQLRLSLTAQNILLSSSYTGADPEPSLEDVGSSSNGSEPLFNFRNPLAPGIDRRTNYLPARTFTLGIHLTL